MLTTFRRRRSRLDICGGSGDLLRVIDDRCTTAEPALIAVRREVAGVATRPQSRHQQSLDRRAAIGAAIDIEHLATPDSEHGAQAWKAGSTTASTRSAIDGQGDSSFDAGEGFDHEGQVDEVMES